MDVIRARFPDAPSFLTALSDDDDGTPLMFAPTTRQRGPGEEVVIEVKFPELPNKQLLKGTVVSWRPAVPRMRVRAGVLVAIAPSERPKLAFVVDVALGKRTGARRRHARVPVDLPVRWRPRGSPEYRAGSLREISIGGAQLVTDGEVSAGDAVLLELLPPGGARAFPVAGKVTYEGKDHYGVRFVYRDGGGKRRLSEIVRRLVSGPTIPG